MMEHTLKTSQFIALQCPTCGARLQVAAEKNGFGCDHCGNRYLLDRNLNELAEPEREQLKPNVTYTQHIQQWLRVGEHELFLHSIGVELVQKQRVLYMEVSYRNTSTSAVTCRHDQWLVFDREGYTYEPVKDFDFRALYEENSKRYVGMSRVISPGMKLRGWLAFVIPNGTVAETLQFSAGVPTKTVEIELRLE